MHELSITQSILALCEEQARGHRVEVVVVEIGSLSGVIPESIEFCFDACSRGTLLNGARIEIEIVPGLGRCPVCEVEVPLQSIFDSCPSCGAYGLQVLAGEELRVKELELEMPRGELEEPS